MKKRTITIATRKSPLALWQANWVKSQLLLKNPQLHVELLGITTEADRLKELPIEKIGGKGIFVKALETALLENAADIAVHSMKDVPMQLPKGLSIPCICKRENPKDALVSKNKKSIEQCKVIATSSLRRQSQLAARFPNIILKPIRGNVETRLKKLADNNYDGIILASAGLTRLALEKHIHEQFDTDIIVPAPGQGALGIECREDDNEIIEMVCSLDHPETDVCVQAERQVSRALGGSCHMPLGAFAEYIDDKIYLRAVLSTPNGKQLIRVEKWGSFYEPIGLGQSAAEALLRNGGDAILREIKP